MISFGGALDVSLPSLEMICTPLAMTFPSPESLSALPLLFLLRFRPRSNSVNSSASPAPAVTPAADPPPAIDTRSVETGGGLLRLLPSRSFDLLRSLRVLVLWRRFLNSGFESASTGGVSDWRLGSSGFPFRRSDLEKSAMTSSRNFMLCRQRSSRVGGLLSVEV